MQEVESFLEKLVEDGEIPGAAWAVAGPNGILAEGAHGHAVRTTEEQVVAGPDTVYDLASLTKPLVTSFLYLRLEKDLGLHPGDSASRFLPEMDRMDKREIRIEHLLAHASGLPAWAPLYVRGSSFEEYLVQVRDLPLEHRPGSRVLYSDIGYIMLGEILCRCATVSLDLLARTAIFEPLGLSSTAFNPPLVWRPRVAATEDSCHYERMLAGPEAANYGGFRSGVIRGEVHDQNAWVLGGVAGHAGLFSTARETAAIGLEYLGAGRGLLDGRLVERAQRSLTEGLNEERTCAFRMAAGGRTAAGPDLPPEAIGHNGFTGTSVWIDPSRHRVYTLLTNRIHPQVRESVDMLAVRQRFHSLASRL